ncbi:universal stress protein [Natronomonas sp. LN261]|uniref:universal stress protein n=1 Tax=Natronomonas sp. LN261 TaxID=2750669 RepID=UPI0015EF55BE|nr:universal stress protein [Natronomonas sp. LN261]
MYTKPNVLVPIRVLDGESIPEGIAGLVKNAHVVLLGYHIVPEQTATGQMRMQFETEANNRLDELEDLLESEGATVETRLVFTRDGQKTIDRMIYEHDCLAVLDPDAVGTVESVLVPIRGTVGLDRIARVVAGLFADTDADVTLYHVAESGETNEDARTLLDGLVTRLTEGGIDRTRITLMIRHGDEAVDAITDEAGSFDVVVIGESDPSIATFVFGMPAETVADQFLGPVFVVQRERPDDDASG